MGSGSSIHQSEAPTLECESGASDTKKQKLWDPLWRWPSCNKIVFPWPQWLHAVWSYRVCDGAQHQAGAVAVASSAEHCMALWQVLRSAPTAPCLASAPALPGTLPATRCYFNKWGGMSWSLCCPQLRQTLWQILSIQGENKKIQKAGVGLFPPLGSLRPVVISPSLQTHHQRAGPLWRAFNIFSPYSYMLSGV